MLINGHAWLAFILNFHDKAHKAAFLVMGLLSIKLKANLRNKIEASPIFDSDTFARNFEDLLLKIHN